MKKTFILPILFMIAFILKTAFGIEIPEEVLNGLADTLAELILIIGTIVGIVKGLKKKTEEGEE